MKWLLRQTEYYFLKFLSFNNVHSTNRLIKNLLIQLPAGSAHAWRTSVDGVPASPGLRKPNIMNGRCPFIGLLVNAGVVTAATCLAHACGSDERRTGSADLSALNATGRKSRAVAGCVN